MQLKLYTSLAIILSLLSGAATQLSNCLNTSQTICNGAFPGDNRNHIQYECIANLSSSFELTSCDNGDPTMGIYWFWYDDVCRFNTTRNLPFAIISPAGDSPCVDNPMSTITQEACENNYSFTRQTMIIENITESTSQKYICYLSNNQANMNYTSTTIYSINISVPTTTATVSSTSFSTISSPTNNTEGTTGNFSGTESTPSDDKRRSTQIISISYVKFFCSPRASPPLEIILPVVFGALLIILLIIAGSLYYRRRRRRRPKVGKKPDKYKLEPISSITQRQTIYGDDISTLDSEHNHSIWQPVQKKK